MPQFDSGPRRYTTSHNPQNGRENDTSDPVDYSDTNNRQTEDFLLTKEESTRVQKMLSREFANLIREISLSSGSSDRIMAILQNIKEIKYSRNDWVKNGGEIFKQTLDSLGVCFQDDGSVRTTIDRPIEKFFAAMRAANLPIREIVRASKNTLMDNLATHYSGHIKASLPSELEQDRQAMIEAAISLSLGRGNFTSSPFASEIQRQKDGGDYDEYSKRLEPFRAFAAHVASRPVAQQLKSHFDFILDEDSTGLSVFRYHPTPLQIFNGPELRNALNIVADASELRIRAAQAFLKEWPKSGLPRSGFRSILKTLLPTREEWSAARDRISKSNLKEKKQSVARSTGYSLGVKEYSWEGQRELY